MSDAKEVREKLLVSNCRSNMSHHQERLYKYFYGFAKGIALRYTRSEEDAMEVVNDAFLKVFKAVNKLDEHLTFRPWLKKIVVNTAIDVLRRNINHSKVLRLEYAAGIPTSFGALEEINAAELLDLLRSLPEMQQTVFNLVEIDGYSHEEIGKLLHIPAGSSRVYLSRAKEMLRTYLTKEKQRHGTF